MIPAPPATIKCKDLADCIRLQEYLFENGWTWRDGQTTPLTEYWEEGDNISLELDRYESKKFGVGDSRNTHETDQVIEPRSPLAFVLAMLG